LDLQISKENESNRFTWKRGHLFDRLITLILYEKSIQMSSGQAKIVKVEEKPTSKYRPLPLRTVEFQKAASRFLKISSDQVMNLAEKLYNRGFISYPRTETDSFEFGSEQLKSLVQKQSVDNVFGHYAKDLLESDGFRMPRKGKNNDKAHPPIHPTSSGEELSGQERAVFEFVARRFLACCSEDAKGMETKISAQVGIEEFECKGIRVTELNYLLIYKYEKWTEQDIAPFVQGEILPIKEFLMKEGSTSAPLLLSESDLITCMDKNGIGTDATIHEHIQKIIVRKYAIKGRDSRFIPTRLGVALVEAFDQLGLDLSLTQPKIRSKLERDLSSVCSGQLTKIQVIHESKEMYKKVYRKVVDEFHRLLRVFSKYLGDSRNNNGRNSGTGSDSDDEGGLPPGNPYDSMPIPKHSRSSPTDDDEDSGGVGDELPFAAGTNKRTRGKAATGIRTKKLPIIDLDDEYSAPAKIIAKRTRLTKVKSNQEDNNSPNCHCSVPAAKRTVSKDGPNKGKQFWGCPKDFNLPYKCNFFEWIESGGSSYASTSVQAKTTKTIIKNRDNPAIVLDDEGDMRCKCGLIMKKDVMKTGKDSGREFVKCPRIVQKCGMFVFLDGNGSSAGSNYSKSTNSKKQKCFKCDKTGHWANTCPN
jgi:DNA topoisomerase III